MSFEDNNVQILRDASMSQSRKLYEDEMRIFYSLVCVMCQNRSFDDHHQEQFLKMSTAMQTRLMRVSEQFAK